MGTTCSQGEDTHDTEASRNMLPKDDDEKINIDNELIENESDVEFYTPGAGIRFMTVDVCNRSLLPQDMAQLFEFNSQQRVPLYYTSSMVHACMGDGILGEREKEYIYNEGKTWKISDDDLQEALKGKDYTKELCQAWSEVYKKFKESCTDEEIKQITHGIGKHMILSCICACSQDGFVKKEYKVIEKMASNMGISKSQVNRLIKIVKMEKFIAREIKDMIAV